MGKIELYLVKSNTYKIEQPEMSKRGPLSINAHFMSFCINFDSKMKANTPNHPQSLNKK
jgi:hypothetical protein